MLYEIRADRDVTSKGPEGSGTRRRTVKLPGGPMTLTIGAQPIYLNADVLPPEIAGDEHLLTKAVTAESFDSGATIINLKAERVQEEMAADPGDTTDLKAERVQEESVAAPGEEADLKAERVQEEMAAEPASAAPPAADDKLKAERVQNPTAVEAINKKRR
jgi:hypothetical protein